MIETIKKFTGIATSVIPLSILKNLLGYRLIIPVYHLVTDMLPVHIKHLYQPRRINTFRKDMEFFTHHFDILYPDRLLEYCCNRSIEIQNGFLPTFDDGLREIYEIAAPYLYHMGIPAIFFINNDFVNNKDMFFRFKASLLTEKVLTRLSHATMDKLAESLGLTKRNTGRIKARILSISYQERDLLDKAAEVLEVDFNEYLTFHKPYMDDEQIKDLQDKGFIIGAHGKDHQLLSALSEDEIILQIRESVNDIFSKYTSLNRFFAFPFTDHGIPGKVLKVLHDQNFPLVDASFGTAGLKQDIVPNHIQRIPMEKSNLSVSRIIKTEYVMCILKKVAGRNLILREDTDKVNSAKNITKS